LLFARRAVGGDSREGQDETKRRSENKAIHKFYRMPSKRLGSFQSDLGLHERVDPLGRPQQAGFAEAMQGLLMPPIQHRVAQLRKVPANEFALEEAKFPSVPNAL
jgi:hypothetical protein